MIMKSTVKETDSSREKKGGGIKGLNRIIRVTDT